MRIFLFILTFALSNTFVIAQTFVGTSTDKMKAYHCTLKIYDDSFANFIYKRDFNAVYADYRGKIVKLGDTLYSFTATMTIGQFYMKSLNKDTIYIQLDSNIAPQLDKIQVEYSDGKTREQLSGYDSLGNPIRLLKIPVNKKLFNNKKGKDFINITIKHKNYLAHNFLSFKIPYGSASSFKAGRLVNFNVVIKNGQLYTTGVPPLQTGHFKLEILIR